MLGLTPLGIIHTLISLVAVAAGILAFVRYKEIVPDSGAGRWYVWGTVLTCLTGFGIFQHGGFGKPHALGILTLLALAIAALAWRGKLFGRAAPYVATVSYSLTFFFHMVPGITETTTRLPLGAPLFSGPDAPGLQAVIGVVFLCFLAGVTLQLLHLRSTKRFTVAF
ncbi:MAG TPA: hypothetical protein VLA16_19205 [Ideonella sp.]|nr:hypothetical protein [Ideonella sp.]